MHIMDVIDILISFINILGYAMILRIAFVWFRIHDQTLALKMCSEKSVEAHLEAQGLLGKA